MRIKSIETAGFGNLPDGVLELDAGLTAIIGANEKGKTFTWKAIVEGLYGDATTASTAEPAFEAGRTASPARGIFDHQILVAGKLVSPDRGAALVGFAEEHHAKW